jgi:phosphohistidine phosphatase
VSRLLLILRHGKSDWSTGKPDFERPLKERGRLGAQQIGAWLLGQGLAPDWVVSSDAERAKGTAEEVVKTLGMKPSDIHWERRVYAAYRDELLAVLRDCPPSAKRVMLVGHNPGLEDLVTYLAGAQVEIPPDGKLLPTAALARLSMPEQWDRLDAGCARLESVIRPADLPKTFGDSPLPESEGRLRPDYYYTQSAVIPYRLRDGEPEILLVSSRKNKRWVVPKGIREPELSSAESAAKEAWEEAGARGHVDPEPLGQYQYPKWGGVCSVDVFPMRVSDLAEDEHWEESHRMRKWVTPKTAAKLLKEPRLKDLVRQLEGSLAGV